MVNTDYEKRGGFTPLFFWPNAYINSCMKEWNWYCYDCTWKGTPPDLVLPDEDGEWQCPNCNSENIEDRGWHKDAVNKNI